MWGSVLSGMSNTKKKDKKDKACSSFLLALITILIRLSRKVISSFFFNTMHNMTKLSAFFLCLRVPPQQFNDFIRSEMRLSRSADVHLYIWQNTCNYV